MSTGEVTIRPVANTDSPGIIDLVARCFADYPGCVLDVEGEEPGLLAPADSFERFWVAVAEGRVVGMIAAARHATDAGEPAVELKKLYVAHEHRGTGLARRLVERVEEYARTCGAAVIDLWSDTRFERAHAAYKAWGWELQPRTRALHDKSRTLEYYFTRRLHSSTRRSR